MILFIAEHSNGKLKKSALELANAANKLATDLGSELSGAIIGDNVAEAANELTNYVDKVITVESPELADMRAEPYATVVTELAKDLGAKAVMLSASKSGLSYSPRVAIRLDAPLLEDVIELSVDNGQVVAKRYSYLARVSETVKANSLPVVISIKPNIFPVAEANANGNVEAKHIELSDADKRVKVGEKSASAAGRVALEEANTVVAGGRGVGEGGFENLVEPLADVLSAGIGTTRAVVDAGWRPYSEQIGQTGKTVSPELYIALGISGAVQHLSGMNRSKIIVAVNKDADAPIFKAADYGIVGDVNNVVPELIAAAKAAKS